jgi:UDP-glucose 4-epimerase
MKALVVGGAGYIGSHTCVELAERGHDVVVLDNLCNASRDVIKRIGEIVGRPPRFIEGDIRNEELLRQVFRDEEFDIVLHFAALKSVGESWDQPLKYFDNNISGTIALLRTMQEARVRHLVFSSSATVYGDPESCPIDETAPLRVTNPYGRTKLVMEDLIGDLCQSDTTFRAAVLRYFNPVGAHASALIGEKPSGIPNNLMPYVCQVAAGMRECLNVFGSDYPTRDGTGVRDYIHVCDLARAHVDAIDALFRRDASLTVNLGTGRGYSVLEVVKAFERASGRTVPVKMMPRRAGDVAECYADPTLAKHLLGWQAEFDLERMCSDAWRAHSHRQESPEGDV